MALTLTTAAVLGLLGAALGSTQVLEIGAQPAPRAAQLRPAARGDGQALGALRAEVIAQLPQGWRLGGLRFLDAVPRPPAGVRGSLRLATSLPADLTTGANRVEVTFLSGEVAWARLAAGVTLWPAPGAGAARPAPVVARNQEVMVVVRNGNVTVQTKGVAQRAAAQGERVAVLPHGSAHTVQATVRDAKTVEVAL